MTILTNHDVDNVRFTATQFREGYSQREVDRFLEKVANSLKVLQERADSSGYAPDSTHVQVLTVDDVQNVKFAATRLREGYEQDEVDSFLDHVVETMRYLEAHGATQTSGYESQWGGSSWSTGVNTYGSASYSTPSATESSSSQAIAQRDQYIAQLQQENAYLRAELEAAQRRSGMTGF